MFMFSKETISLCVSQCGLVLNTLAISLPTVVVKIKTYILEIGLFPNNIPKKSKQKRYHTKFS